jgi:hypothetical protein
MIAPNVSPSQVLSMPASEADPSMALVFYCKNQAEFHSFVRASQRLTEEAKGFPPFFVAHTTPAYALPTSRAGNSSGEAKESACFLLEDDSFSNLNLTNALPLPAGEGDVIDSLAHAAKATMDRQYSGSYHGCSEDCSKFSGAGGSPRVLPAAPHGRERAESLSHTPNSLNAAANSTLGSTPTLAYMRPREELMGSEGEDDFVML